MDLKHASANWKIAAWLFAGFLALFVALTRGHFYLSDEVQVFQQTRSLWERGDLSVAPNINTVRGRGGLYYAQYGVGQSVLALPFYAAGKTVHRLLDRAGAASWIQTFAGPVIGDPNFRWGGEVEIFFVNLFCAFVMAALVAVFYLFNLRLGAAPRWALISAVTVGLATHLTGFGVEFLQHPAEALFVLLAFYFLFEDSENPRARYRLLAGAMAGMLILVRASGVVLIPALTLYLFWNVYRRLHETARAVAGCALFLIPAACAIFITMWVNYVKWGQASFSGSYQAFNTFTNSWLVSIYGYLFSPGQSIFLFSPILILAPVYFRPFAQRYRAETSAILGLTASYALFYGRSVTWHGQWCFGPRYLMAMVPLLTLPLGLWLGSIRRRAWLAIVPLLLAGAFIEVLHVAVNVSYVFYRAGYTKLIPSDAFIFIPQICQIVTHWHALTAWDDQVDMWVVNVARELGASRAMEILFLPCALLALSIERIRTYLTLVEDASVSESHSFASGITNSAL